MSDSAQAALPLAEKIENSAKTKEPVEGSLKTNDRIIARVTDGIYREPWSAFRELISNAFDADATKVSIDCDYPFFKEIRITDNGNGMNEKIVGDLLENIGGSSKRTIRGKALGTANKEDPTRSPSGRKLIGKIGIGLFAVSQLTQQFQIITKRKGDKRRVSASIRLNTFQEDAFASDQADKGYASGTYSVLAEDTLDTDIHGTTIILTSIRPAVREKLQSQEIWSAIDENEPDDGSGLIDVVVPPQFNIGRVDEDGALAHPPKLPWQSEDSPLVKFAKLVDAAISTSKSSKEQANLAHFDNYLKMLWRVSVASPIDYIDGHPFDIKESDGYEVYSLSNKKKGSANQVHLNGKSLREAFSLKAGNIGQLPNFVVTIDSVELRRPIRLPSKLASFSRLERPLIFVGQVSTNFGGASVERSGGSLSFEAYLYWNTRIVPKENIGSIIRVNDASGTLFDPEFLGYQVSEQTRKKQVTCEIFVNEGLDGALNIDRESFNTSNPHYLYIQKWLHSAFRQFATMHKRLGRSIKPVVLDPQDIAFRRSVEIWSKMRGSDIPPPLISRPSTRQEGTEFFVGDIPVSLPRSVGEPSVSARSDLIDAISIVLDAHGILERLTDEGRAELIFDLVSILENAK
ncbi:ATP-binding protein [Mesorhizobium sp. CO1-1-11]|uniref:ATP-binding protein n=1 Tax=Mesorhizobium sp. CO1-1-11 TaxID=2876636 RepID=UPI001CCD46FE|nr:ATP-binding protein [Mesorhizobium sp. CO1-1-11]MBZ9725553.1 ATP-binding protein [Mesorhizobium sp. CO1-1-11]